MYEFFDLGSTLRSAIEISLAAVPSVAAIFWSRPSMSFVPGVPALCFARSRGKIVAASGSAT